VNGSADRGEDHQRGAAELTVNFVRYVRKQTARTLYEHGFFTDQVPSAGAVAVFYENECPAIDVMR
jgi:hypothetical protein